jgi:cation diffusion facilitator CzcD-associated flavoprotein CzcO
MSPSLPVTRVAIIGAGSSGLATLKQVVDAFARPEVKQRTSLDVVVYEAKSDVGGVW